MSICSQIFIKSALLCTLLWTPANSTHSQNCNDLEVAAIEKAFRTDYPTAADLYFQAAKCCLLTNNYIGYFNNYLGYLDCLRQQYEYLKLAQETQTILNTLSKHEHDIPSQDVAIFHESIAMFILHITEHTQSPLVVCEHYAKHLKFLQSTKDITDTTYLNARIAQCHLALSRIFLYTGDYEKMLHHNLASSAIFSDYPSYYIDEGIFVQNDILRLKLFHASGDVLNFESAKKNMLSKVNLLKRRTRERKLSIYYTICQFHLHSHSLDSAAAYLARLQSLDSLGQHRAQILQLSGDYYLASDNLKKAEQAYLDALRLIRAQQGEKNEAVATCHLALGKLYLRTHRYREALDALHRGIYSLSDIPQVNPSVFDNPPQTSLYSQRILVDMLRGKAEALFRLGITSADREMSLSASWHTIRQAIRFMESLRTGYSADADKSLLVEDSYPVFELALEIAFHRYQQTQQVAWIDSAFVLMEESKALNLRDAILHGQARQFAGIPDSLVQLEHTLLLEISGKERLIREYRSSPYYRDDTELAYQRDLAQKKEQYRQLIAHYAQAYPRYFALRHKPIHIDIATFRSALRERQELREFFVGDSAVYLLRISDDGQIFQRIRKDVDLAALVSAYRNSLSAFMADKSRTSLEAYAQSANRLYTLLFPDPIETGTSILVIPDGVLSYVAFSGLLRTMPDNLTDIRSYDFLLWHHDIAYSHSASLYLEVSRLNARPVSADVLVCAPVFDNLTGIAPLRYNLQEARVVRQLTDGLLLAGGDCTVAGFTDRLTQRHPRILHLATHGAADDRSGDASYLAFSGDALPDALLYARDLYAMQLDMDLIFLSACETGTGELRRGEGMISLARAFFYAGARSIVTTLWRTEDTRTAAIAKHFYSLLAQGKSKDHALADAQRTYLKDLSPQESHFAHPAYWSAFIPVGNMSAVEIATQQWPGYLWLTVAACVLLLCSLVVYRWRK